MTNVNKQKTVLDVNVLLNLPSAEGKLYLCYCLLQTINWSCCGLFKVRKKIHIRAGAHWGKQRGRVKSKLSHSCFWMKTLCKVSIFTSSHFLQFVRGLTVLIWLVFLPHCVSNKIHFSPAFLSKGSDKSGWYELPLPILPSGHILCF